MQTIIIVIHLMVVVSLVGVVLLQRSEGGGLGIGGGSGFMSARGAANALTRTTGILAGAFFATSLALSLIARYGESPTDILDRLPQNTPQQQQDDGSGGNGVLDQLGGSQSGDSEGGGQGTASQSGDAPAGQSEQSNEAGQSSQPASGSDSTPAEPESQVPTGQ